MTPNAIGLVIVDIAAGVAADTGGNGNTAAARLPLGLPYDDDHNSAIDKNEAIAADGTTLPTRLAGTGLA